MLASPTLRLFAERLRVRGKRAKVAIVAAMRKRLLLAWTLLRTDRALASTEPLRPRERTDAADQTGSPVPSPATAQSAGG